MKKRNSRILKASALALLLFTWTLFFIYYSPQELLESLGVRNSYLLLFFVSFAGSLGSITTFTAYPAIVTFILAGLPTLPVVLIAGAGLTLGDTCFYYFGTYVRDALIIHYPKQLERVTRWIEHDPLWLVQALIYLYTGWSPFPNNLLMVVLAISGYRFSRVILPLALGNITLPLLFSYLTSYGVPLFT